MRVCGLEKIKKNEQTNENMGKSMKEQVRERERRGKREGGREKGTEIKKEGKKKEGVRERKIIFHLLQKIKRPLTLLNHPVKLPWIILNS